MLAMTPSAIEYICCIAYMYYSKLGWKHAWRIRILLKLVPTFLFFFSPVIHVFFFFIHLFFSIMLALIDSENFTSYIHNT